MIVLESHAQRNRYGHYVKLWGLYIWDNKSIINLDSLMDQWKCYGGGNPNLQTHTCKQDILVLQRTKEIWVLIDVKSNREPPIKTLVVLVLLYASETWVMSRSSDNLLGTFIAKIFPLLLSVIGRLYSIQTWRMFEE